ncbi:hypothetical protein F2Q69_00057976 [Brassica cretica]|uniref:Uncharacterized protein n=1 Tax=Brassica cretica TaxID=69181 RepID=A0A8S9MM00_BRACR|nr:hypothetical protein F2Q69_00057976 [Brassica cretica]
MRPFGLIFTVMFLVSAFSESRTADCRVLFGGSWEDIGQSKNHGVDLRSKELVGVVIRGYKRLRSLSSALVTKRLLIHAFTLFLLINICLAQVIVNSFELL